MPLGAAVAGTAATTERVLVLTFVFNELQQLSSLVENLFLANSVNGF